MKHPTINQARATREAAAAKYHATQDEVEYADKSLISHADYMKRVDRHIKAWRDWQDAQKEWETAQRRANWIRAKRIITLAAYGRQGHYATNFLVNDFKVVR